MSVAERLEEVRGRLETACRDAGRSPDEVRLIAVSKKQPDRLLDDAFAAGQRDFGENYAQELARKQARLPEARFHMIGHLQRNKAKLVAGCALVHTVDSEKLGRALGKLRDPADPLPVLVEVNVADEASKAGVAPDAVEPLVLALRGIDGLEPRGLMCIPPVDEGRRWFSALRALAERCRATTGLALPELSMGMSADYEDAIREGATLVRVGTAVFGPRPERGARSV